MKITKNPITGNYLTILKEKYVSAQYISKVLDDNDFKINYDKFINYENIKYFLLCK